MIFNAAYEGPPYAPVTALGCGGCQRGAANLGAIGPSQTTISILAVLATLAIGLTLWGHKKPSTSLKGRRRR